MRLLDRIAGAWQSLVGRGAPPSGSGVGPMWVGGPFHPDAFGAKRAPAPWELIEAYKSIIFFCTNLNADGVARVPLRLYAASGSGVPKPRRACCPRRITRAAEGRLRSKAWLARTVGRAAEIHEVTEHPALHALDHPDPEGNFDRHQLLGLICRYIDVVGSAYLKPVAAGDLFPDEIWPLQSQYVWPVRKSTSALVDQYTYFNETYAFDQLLRIRLRPSLHDPYGAGYAAAQAACEYARLEDVWVSIQEQLYGAGPRPGLIVSAADPKMPLGGDEAERLEKQLNAKFARGGANRVWVPRTAVKVATTTYPPADLGGKEVAEYNLIRIANCFGVPAPYVVQDTNLANLQASKEYHATNAIEPRCDCVASGLTRLVQRYDPRLFFAFDPAVGEDVERRAKIVDMKLKSGERTINEVREEDGLGSVEWGDEPWLPSTLRQPGEERPQPPVPGAAGDDPPADPENPDDAESEDDDAGDGEPARRSAQLLEQAERLLVRVQGELDGLDDVDDFGRPVRRGRGGGGDQGPQAA